MKTPLITVIQARTAHEQGSAAGRSAPFLWANCQEQVSIPSAARGASVAASKTPSLSAAAVLQGASYRRHPGDADLGLGSQPVDQLSRVMLKMSNVVKLQFQLVKWEPGKP